MSEEILNQNESATNAMTVTESMKSDLLCAAKWAKFLCIVGCVGVVRWRGTDAVRGCGDDGVWCCGSKADA